MSAEQLQGLAGSGRLSPNDLVWREGMDGWAPAYSVGKFSFHGVPVPPPPPVASSSPTELVPPNRPITPLARRLTWAGAIVGLILVSALAGWLAHSLLNAPEDGPDMVSSAPVATVEPIDEPETPLAKDTDVAPDTPPEDLVSSPTEPQVIQTEPEVSTQSSDSTALFQEVDVQRQSRLVVHGLPIAQELSYRVLSLLRVGEPDTDGIRVIEQTVLETKLEDGDEMSHARYRGALQALKGQQFTFRLNSAREVVEFKGHKDSPGSVAISGSGGLGLTVTSVMDEDGWKEIAGLSFFLPKEGVEQGDAWKKEMTHDWGSLGSWRGETAYKLKGQSQELQLIDYVHNMTYTPPAPGGGGLPFQVAGGAFQTEQAGGEIRFDAGRQRVDSVQERFHVRGDLSTSVLGQASRIEIEEQQSIAIRMLDQYPWEP